MAYWDTPGKSDEWYTPKYIFEALGCEFDLDVASPFQRWHVPAKVWLDEQDDGLKLAPFWTGFIWMNPPFGGRNGLEPWLDAFFAHGNGIALTPDRTSAPWFLKAWLQADSVLFTPKVRFIRADGTLGVSPSNGTALMAVGEKGMEALERGAAAGLGILGMPIKKAA
ncbi:MAG: adenine methyltransferase [Proteobacteria bacterium]|nr:adenine methyltransferase [Pseudomonadota bacterium]